MPWIKYRHNSDKYRGLDYELVDEPPRGVVMAAIERNAEIFRQAEQRALRLDMLYAKAQPCALCGDAPSLTPKVQVRPEKRVTLRDCPECGRANVIAVKQQDLVRHRR